MNRPKGINSNGSLGTNRCTKCAKVGHKDRDCKGEVWEWSKIVNFMEHFGQEEIEKEEPVARLQVKKLSKSAVLPRKGSTGAAGLDIASVEDAVIPPEGKAIIQTDISLKLPTGTYGRIAPRSGLAAKHHIQIGAGVIDEDYTGPIGVVMFNHSKKPFKVRKNDRIAQLICEKIEKPMVMEVDELEETERAGKGFGSTDHCNQVYAMGKKKVLVCINGEINGEKAYILVDSGSTGNFISSRFVEAMGLPVKKNKSNPGSVAMANGHQEKIMCLKKQVGLKMKKYETKIKPQVINLAVYDLVLGQEWLEKENPLIDWKTKKDSYW